MNEMVDAVFGQPKNELLKLIQRSPPSSNPVASCQASEEQAQPTTEMTSGIVDVESQSRHDFQETNSFRPCTCAHCNGLVNWSTTTLSLIISSNIPAIFEKNSNIQLWGPLRQGYKCRECGLTAHKMCKDVMNVTCRPKSLMSSPFTGIAITQLVMKFH